jgi:Sulfotransferase family
MSEATLPTFLVIGAAKAGTTSLYRWLVAHPQIFMSRPKEPHYFTFADTTYRAEGVVTTWDEYVELFRGAAGVRATGEASTSYLWSPEAPARIKAVLPRAKLIAVLRQPAERAYSAYLHCVREGGEMLDFVSALAAEPERDAQGWPPGLWLYRDVGFYARQLRRYLDLFPRDQIHVLLHDDLISDPRAVVRDIFRFVGVDHTFEPDVSVSYNPGRLHRSSTLERMISLGTRTRLRLLLPSGARNRLRAGLSALNRSEPAPLDPELRRALTREFREDILQLQDLINRDLPRWLAE